MQREGLIKKIRRDKYKNKKKKRETQKELATTNIGGIGKSERENGGRIERLAKNRKGW